MTEATINNEHHLWKQQQNVYSATWLNGDLISSLIVALLLNETTCLTTRLRVQQQGCMFSTKATCPAIGYVFINNNVCLKTRLHVQQQGCVFYNEGTCSAVRLHVQHQDYAFSNKAAYLITRQHVQQ
jgi:hypothetical protein